VRRILLVLAGLNVTAIVLALLTGNFPSHWPEYAVPPQIGAPLIHLAGSEQPDAPLGGVIAIWYDYSISNTIITSWIVMAILIVFGFLAGRAATEQPTRLQGFFEWIIQLLIDFMREAGGSGVTKYLPLFGTLFLFALFSNWLSLVPLVGQIELLHKPTADYHTNLAMALTGFVWYQVEGFRKHGPGYVTRWLNFPAFKEGPLVGTIMFLLVGPIDFVSELFRILTLTLRLWANMWAGEVLIAVLGALLIVPAFLLPFIGLEIFVGFIQAFVFAFLVLVYIILALESHGSEHEAHETEETQIPATHPAAHAA
jgi:F-type H+-transporting ATPase subunit a